MADTEDDSTSPERRIRDAVDTLERYCSGPEGDVLDVLEALADFYDDRTSMRDMSKPSEALRKAVERLDRIADAPRPPRGPWRHHWADG